MLILATVLVVWTHAVSSLADEATVDKGAGRQIVLMFEESSNTRLYSGRANKEFEFHIIRHTFEGDIETISGPTREADAVIAAIQQIENQPMTSDCDSFCCCGFIIERVLPDVIRNYSGSIILQVTDCVNNPSAGVIAEISTLIRETKTLVFQLHPLDSYCVSTGSDTTVGAISEMFFNIYLNEIGDALLGLLAFYDSRLNGGSTFKYIVNQTLNLNFKGDNVQALALFLPFGTPTRPIAFYGGDGKPLTTNVQTLIANEKSGAQITFIHGGCEKGWVQVGAYCYFRLSRPTSWQNAEQACRDMQATLPSVVTQKELKELIGTHAWDEEERTELETGISLEPTNYWLALDDINGNQSFRWLLWSRFITISRLDFTAWDDGEPSTALAPGRRCGAIRRLTGKWFSTTCIALRSALCQRPVYLFDQSVPKTYLTQEARSMNINTFNKARIISYTMY